MEVIITRDGSSETKRVSPGEDVPDGWSVTSGPATHNSHSGDCRTLTLTLTLIPDPGPNPNPNPHPNPNPNPATF